MVIKCMTFVILQYLSLTRLASARHVTFSADLNHRNATNDNLIVLAVNYFRKRYKMIIGGVIRLE